MSSPPPPSPPPPPPPPPPPLWTNPSAAGSLQVTAAGTTPTSLVEAIAPPPGWIQCVVAPGVCGFPGTHVRLDLQEATSDIVTVLDGAVAAHCHRRDPPSNPHSAVGLVGLRSMGAITTSVDDALRGVVGAFIVVARVVRDHDHAPLQAVLRATTRFLVLEAREASAAATSSSGGRRAGTTTGAHLVHVRVREVVDQDLQLGLPLGAADPVCVQAVGTVTRFLESPAGQSVPWRVLRQALGPAPSVLAPNRRTDATAADFAALGHYMAAAVPVRSGHSSRQRLLATVSARGRLEVASDLWQSHPPVTRAQARALEPTVRRRVGHEILASVGTLRQLAIDAVAVQVACAGELPSSLLRWLGQASLREVASRVGALGMLAPSIVAGFGVAGLTTLRLEDCRGTVTTTNFSRALMLCTKLTKLELVRMTTLTDGQIAPLLTQLQGRLIELSVEGCTGLIGGFLASIDSCTTLTTLSIAGTSATAASMARGLATLHSLRSLDVSGTMFNDAAAAIALPPLGPTLTTLRMASTLITEGSGPIAFRSLAALDVAMLCFSEHVYCFDWLVGWRTLRSLDLSLCPRLEDASMGVVVAALPMLEVLNISKTDVRDAGFARLRNLEHLRVLHAEGLVLTDAIGATLTMLRALQTLSLLYSLGVSGGIVHSLANIEEMRVLKMPYKPTGLPLVDDSAVAAIAARGASSLRWLSMGGQGITDGAIESLAALSNSVERIDLWHTKVTPGGVAALQAATGLSIDDSIRATKGTYLLSL